MIRSAIISLLCVLILRINGKLQPSAGSNNSLRSNNTRFNDVSPRNRDPKTASELLLFISITSSPMHSHLRHANRYTWLLPCIASPFCDYRFFIDKAKENCSDLFDELVVYNDIVFRDGCDLMKRHPYDVNYGNSPPRTEILAQSPDYLWRRLYKIDWKVCFTRYARDNQLMAEYHAFVEDDSFVCTENLLHQVSLLHRRGRTERLPVFRTGTAMFDGFDDSSTFMHRDVAVAFANHYGEDGFNCSHVVDRVNSESWNASMWLSWGNSWMRLRCDWVKVMHDRAGIDVIKPNMDCVSATALNVSAHVTALSFPCSDHQVVMHHGTAGELLLRAPVVHVRHTCEYMLLIDKVKEPAVMTDLWNTAAVGANFHDYSEIFLHEGDAGWLRTLEVLAKEEAKCMQARGTKEGMKDCLFETPMRRLASRRQREVHNHASVSTAVSSSVQLRQYFFGLYM
jgi:diadenosine tetraphosphatase ApaH/serine/threonine PP2A family protein phosphatase